MLSMVGWKDDGADSAEGGQPGNFLQQLDIGLNWHIVREFSARCLGVLQRVAPGSKRPTASGTVLNWLSQMLVHQEEGESVACAFSVDAEGATLHVAKHPSPTFQDRQFGDMLMSHIDSLFSRMRMGKRVDRRGEVANFIRISIRYSWRRIARKLRLIGAPYKALNMHCDAVSSLFRIINLWTKFMINRYGMAWPGESQMRFIAQSQDQSITALTAFFRLVMLNKLRNAKPTADDEEIEDLYRQFVNVVYVARILLGSDFLTAAVVDEQWRKTLGATDLSFLLRLRRRLERVALYYEGAECFMGAGMGLFTKMMGSKSGNAQPRLTLEWVHDKWPWSEIPQGLDDHNAHHLHPELVLIQHLDACGLHAFHQMMGGNKFACRACVLFSNAMWDELGLTEAPWILPGRGEKVDLSWKIPEALSCATLLTAGVVRYAVEETIEVLREERNEVL